MSRGMLLDSANRKDLEVLMLRYLLAKEVQTSQKEHSLASIRDNLDTLLSDLQHHVQSLSDEELTQMLIHADTSH